MKRLKPFYDSPSLILRQILIAVIFAWLTNVGWRTINFWSRNSIRYLKGLAGMRSMGCFGISPHIVWEVTLRCNLRCIHCEVRGGEAQARYKELETEDALHLIDELKELHEFRTLVFSGGEPLLREDLFKLIAHARDVGFNVFIATNGTLISKKIARDLRRHDVGVVIGLDAMDPEIHDHIRGVHGAFERTIRGIDNTVTENLWTHINLIASKLNFNEIVKLLDYGDSFGALSDFVYQFLPIGRGSEIKNIEIDIKQYMELLKLILKKQRRVRSAIIPVASPQYWAYMLKQRGIRSRRVINLLSRLFNGCSAGNGMIYVKPNGEVWPCPFLQVPLGNILKEDIKEIWRESPVLNNLRDRENLKGKCKTCIYRPICGGCRARAYAATGDYLESDPKCPI